MTALTVIGVDPGRTTGISALTWPCPGEKPAVQLIQCAPGSVGWIVHQLAHDAYQVAKPGDVVAVAVERFVVGPRAGRSSDPQAGQIARELVADVRAMGDWVRIHARSAAEVKPWAVDARLEAIGVRIAGMPHAKDAARHALFAAVRDYGIPDPLSKKARGSQ